MKLMFITDAWFPQVNGVVTTMSTVIDMFKSQGHQIEIVEPSQFATVPLPTYKEIKVSLDLWRVGEKIKAFRPDKIHIVTEGALGIAASIFLRMNKVKYTTAFHTKFPEYVNERYPLVPVQAGYAMMHSFHGRSEKVLVPTPSVKAELDKRGFDNVITWSRGVNTDVFHPIQDDEQDPLAHLDGKKYLYVGRVAKEKNIEAFLAANVDGHKVVVGDGPLREELEAKYPNAHFVGYKKGRELALYYAAADVFVFPSKTDTFGIVMLEANACGTPVAAYPVSGPIDVVVNGETGVVDEDLDVAINACLALNPQDCIHYAKRNSWEATAEILLDNMADAHWEDYAPVTRKNVLSKLLS